MPCQSLRPLALALAAALTSPGALATQFVYEGHLDDLGQPANGRYDLRLTPYSDEAAGATLAAPATFPGVEVRNGRFRLDVDLPLVTSDEVWLEVAVRASGESAFSAIPRRSKAIAAPLVGACWSTLGDAGSNPATNFIGTVDNQPFVVRTANAPSLRISPSAITFGTPLLPITTNSIGGSHANFVASGVRGATIAGGGVPSGDSDPELFVEAPNRVTDHYGSIGGGYNNQAGDNAGTLRDRSFATVGGGFGNQATGAESTVAGGNFNSASGSYGIVGGGSGNVAGGDWSSVGGGTSNVAGAESSTIGGGEANTASGQHSTVGGGVANTASGVGSIVAGGVSNCAGGQWSWAGGNRAKVRPGSDSGDGGSGCVGVGAAGTEGDRGTFVWADSQGVPFISTGPNQFLVRASGGLGINTNLIPPDFETVVRNRDGTDENVQIYLRPASHPRGITLSMQPTATAARLQIAQFDGAVTSDRIILEENGDLSVIGQAFKPGGGPWGVFSDARLKADVAPLSGTLEKLLELRGVEFTYRPETTPKSMYLPGRHVGFVAQEVELVFPDWVSESQGGYKSISPRGFEALTVEAMRELRAESATIDAAQGARIAALEAESAALRAELDRRDADYRTRLERLEALLGERRAAGH